MDWAARPSLGCFSSLNMGFLMLVKCLSVNVLRCLDSFKEYLN